MASTAENIGLVKAAWHFSLAAKFTSSERLLKAGEYEIPTGTNVARLLEIVKAGRSYQRRLVVPEGFSAVEVEILLKQTFGLNSEGLSVPEEGSLLPETYFFNRGETAQALVRRMQAGQAAYIEALWENRAEGIVVKSQEEALILASIVEKETGVSAERATIAAVFQNRLKRGMRLQSDPTVIYGVTAGRALGRPISKADLKADNAYNTYRISGLPPTPISNPGKAALEAVLHPEKVPYLYFVADGKGGHVFANTLKQHNRNVRAWRRLRGSS
ncbi:MAG: endolytic transglycosylase MltG [Kordiimonadaceae bacterium]|nr:endolytic transglycosylase MltG [Kordiimonadaceae bacterium]